MKTRPPLWHLGRPCPSCAPGEALALVACPACGHVAALCEDCGAGWSHAATTTPEAVTDPEGTSCPNCGEATLADFPPATANQLAAAGLAPGEYE
ncbi:MAG: hypothetical protein OEM59_10790 [Rhodospirillales bacterium]|nr:hypothetical protein [Rhodospirillales bacterium]